MRSTVHLFLSVRKVREDALVARRGASHWFVPPSKRPRRLNYPTRQQCSHCSRHSSRLWPLLFPEPSVLDAKWSQGRGL